MRWLKHSQLPTTVARLCHVGVVTLGSVGVFGYFALANPDSASAQAAYGSYVGVGPAFGLSSGDDDEDSKTTANIAIRYKFLKAPVSVRTQILVGDDGTAIVPTLSYDFPLNWRTDLYIGAGASIVPGDGLTPVGNKTAFAIQPGIDYALPNSGFVLFGNAIIAFDAYERGNNTAVSLQGGVGLRF
ncbi:MAG TPA: hypothetical protein IGS53_04150 [Leptolyngbyaceae cyanobacterium M33_DOE_097]|uniref:Porin family protein n=1 Tax=Oscillatoriales cyanobacterium SpSt-418 TaxID=2282169 RepID=A0A7C3KFV1_9CYAN|nr:hypothetical protein [Leptolyngbyaceae cyanobacterium M33_DOE_097]